jgi:hypothetical protein
LNKYLLPLITSIYLLLNVFTAQAAEADLTMPVFKQKFDWLKLSSDEWLKGDILSMYDAKLEFDSEELDMQTIDWDDVAELRSKEVLTIRMSNGTIAQGYVVVKDGSLTLVNNNVVTTFMLSDLLSITSSSNGVIDLWSGYLKIGANARGGNTVQFDYSIGAGIERRDPISRLKIDYIANYSKFEDTKTNEQFVTADSIRLTSTYDWFIHQKIFLRAMDFEYFSDEFLNIEYRLSYGLAAGYHLIDKKTVSWDVNIGPSYQTTKFKSVAENKAELEKSLGLALGTDYSYDITDDIEFEISYQVTLVNEASGKYVHHLETAIAVELTSKFDLDLTLYVDRTQKPYPDDNNILPEQNDYRFVVSLGYDF